jgi:hypothetical protein
VWVEKKVAVLLMRHLLEAVRQRRIEVADSAPYWLTGEQYRERDDGTVELLPSEAPDLVTYARLQSFRPVGMVLVSDQGDCRTFIDENAILECDREFALHVFQVHAYFWFVHVPLLEKEQA